MFDPWVGKILWGRAQQPIPVFLPGKCHGQRSLVGYSSWSQKQLSKTEHRTQNLRTREKENVSNIGFWVQNNKILMIDLRKFHKSLFKWESNQVALISDQLAFLPNGQTYAELNKFSISCLVFTTALCKKTHIRKITTDQLSRHAQQLEILLKCNWLPILLSTDVKQEDSVQHCTKIIG